MRFFISLSFENREPLQPAVAAMRDAIIKAGHTCMPVFVYRQNQEEDPSVLMEQAMTALNKADGLIVEMSTKQVGVGIEMGYVHCAQKPILGVRAKGAETSTTMEGLLSREVIEYENPDDLTDQLADSIRQLPEAIKDQEQLAECEQIRRTNPFYRLALRKATEIMPTLQLPPDIRDNPLALPEVVNAVLSGMDLKRDELAVGDRELNVLSIQDAEHAAFDVIRRADETGFEADKVMHHVVQEMWGHFPFTPQGESTLPSWMDFSIQGAVAEVNGLTSREKR